MTKIVIEIDCGEKFCGKCKARQLGIRSPELSYCYAFGRSAVFEDNGEWKRLPECLAAEVKK